MPPPAGRPALVALLGSALASAQLVAGSPSVESRWVRIGPDQSNDPTRVMLLQSFDAGYICLSILLAILGAACSLELLLRRTSNRGVWNLSLLAGAGTSFGAVSCFALHFIGNQSLTLLRPATATEPERHLTLAYDPGFTVLSLVVSVASMIMAFTVMGLDHEALRRKKPTAPEDKAGSVSSGDESEGVKPAEPHKASVGGSVKWWPTALRKASKEAGSQQRSLDAETIELQSGAGGSLTRASLAKHELATTTPGAAALGLETFRFGSGPPEGAMPSAAARHGPPNDDDDDDGSLGGDGEMNRTQMLATLRRSFASATGGGGGSNTTGDVSPSTGPNAIAGPSKPSYTLPSILPTSPAFDGPLTVDLNSSDHSDLASDASAHGRAPPASLFVPVDFGASSGRPASRASAVSPSREGRPQPPDRSGSFPDFPLQPPFSPARNSSGLAGLTTPNSGGADRRLSLPVASPSQRRSHATSIVIQDQMSFEEFEHSAFGGGRLALIRGSESSEGTAASMDTRRSPAAPSSDRRSSKQSTRSRRPSALTNGSAAALEGDGWGSDMDSGVDPLSPTTPTSHADTGSQAQILPAHHRPSVFGGSSLRKSFQAPLPAGYRDEEEAMAHLATLRRSRENSAAPVDAAGPDGMGNRKAARHLSWAARNLGVGQSSKSEMTKVVVAGTICGFGVAGMHYIGQRSITSIQHIRYNPGVVIASVVIACVAISAGLWIMFIVLRPKLKHSYLKRALVACFLGSATSAMHYVAMMGSSYAVSAGANIPTSAMQLRANRVITALVASLAVVACLVTLVSALFAERTRRRSRAKRRGLVVATAIWDDAGNLLVSPEGMMPVQNIAFESIHLSRSIFSRSFISRPGSISTDSFDSSVLTSEFDISPQHQAFIAALRRTWAWRKGGDIPPPDAVPLFIHNAPSQTSIASEDAIATQDSAWSTHRPSVASEMPVPPSVQRFLERFSDSIARLAEQVVGTGEHVGKLGVLYDRILTTGFISFGSDKKEPGPSDSASSGQMLFLVNRCTPSEKNQLLRRGFMFHTPQAVARVMSGALAVPPVDMSEFLVGAQGFSDVLASPRLQRGKIYVSALVAQALPHGLQIVVGKKDRSILPTVELASFTSISDPILSSAPAAAGGPLLLAQDVGHLSDLVASVSGSSLLSLAHHEMPASASAATAGNPQAQLKRLLAKTLLPLFDHAPPAAAHHILRHLVLSPALVQLFPTASHRASRLPSYSIVFRAMLMPNVDVSELGPALCFESFKLFRAFNECYMADLIRRAGSKVDRLAAAREASIDVPSDEQLYQRRPSRVQFIDAGAATGGISTPPGPSTPDGGSSSGGFHLNADLFAPSAGHGRRASRVSIAPDAADDQPSAPALPHRLSNSRLRQSAKDLRIYPPPAGSSLASSRPSVPRTWSNDAHSNRSSIAPFDPNWMLGLMRDDSGGQP